MSNPDQPGAPAEPTAQTPTARLTGVSALLDGLGERPLHEHADAYDGIHADLQAALAEIDSA